MANNNAANIFDIGAKYETNEITGLLKNLAIENKNDLDGSIEKAIRESGVFNDSQFYFNIALNLKKTSILGYIFENILKLKIENKVDLRIFADLKIKNCNNQENIVSKKIWRLDEIDLNDKKLEKKCTLFWPEDQENPAWDFIAINQLNGSKEIIFYQISVTRYINTKMRETWRIHKKSYKQFEANKGFTRRYYLIHSNMCYKPNRPRSKNTILQFCTRKRKNLSIENFSKYKNSNANKPIRQPNPLNLIFIGQLTSFSELLILKIIFYGDFIRKKNSLCNIRETSMLKKYLDKYKIPYKTNEKPDANRNSKFFYLYRPRTINKRQIYIVIFVSIIKLFKRLELECNDSQSRKTPNS